MRRGWGAVTRCPRRTSYLRLRPRPDLSYPKIAERLTIIGPQNTQELGYRTSPWQQAAAAADRIPHHLDHSDDAVAQAHLAAFGEALDTLPLLAPPRPMPPVAAAAETFERATRIRIRIRIRIRTQGWHARALHRAIREPRTAPVTGDGTGLALFLDTALVVIIAAAHWHTRRHHAQQTEAAHQTLTNLQVAYQQAAVPLAALTQPRPNQKVVNRYDLAHPAHRRPAGVQRTDRTPASTGQTPPTSAKSPPTQQSAPGGQRHR
ncbi:hypothetical protein [Streptomyces sp. GSL17-111]|uniref:hypothetical protein n=1 Tax=Streptomyces sp. GSL17-111 TaxID=3121596 RepID=UPI0030F41D09